MATVVALGCTSAGTYPDIYGLPPYLYVVII